MSMTGSIWYLVAAALCSSLVLSAPAAPLGPADWTDCPPYLSTNLRCANITVPLDYDNPLDETLPLKLLKLPTNNTSGRKGSVVWQYGGPGDPTYLDLIETADGGKEKFGDIRNQFDIVVAEPRGVGINHPVKCDPKFGQVRPKIFPRTEDEYEEALQFYQEMGQSCLEHTGKLLYHMDTLTQAKDLEAVRVALGEGGLNYYGLSWGTLRGSMYAQLWPQNIRAMVLDGVVDHSIDATQFSAAWSQSYSLTQRRMLKWMETNSSSALYGRDVVTLFHDLVKTADRKPLPAPACVTSETCLPEVTGDDIRYAAFQPTNYPASLWINFSQALKEAADNNNASALSLPVSPNDTSSINGLLAIACQDWNFAQTWPEYQRKQFMTDAYSLDASGMLGERFWAMGCQRWPTDVTNPPRPMAVQHPSAPIMMVNALWDPATSYDSMLHVHAQIEGSVVVTRYGEGHGSLPFPGARKVMYEYLSDLVVPEAEHALVDQPVSSQETDFEMLRINRGYVT